MRRHCPTCSCPAHPKSLPYALTKANEERRLKKEQYHTLYGEKAIGLLLDAQNYTLSENFLIEEACRGNQRAWQRVAKDFLAQGIATRRHTGFTRVWTLSLSQP